MALSRELKAYINKKFDEKIKNTRIAKDEARGKYHTEQRKKVVDEVAQELKPEYTAFISKLKEVKDKYKDSIHFAYEIRELIASKLENEIDPKIDTSEITKKFDDEILAIDKQRDTLLIQLSMEKDFEKIKEILAENGIGL
jgi:hypothetical protein